MHLFMIYLANMNKNVKNLWNFLHTKDTFGTTCPVVLNYWELLKTVQISWGIIIILTVHLSYKK